MAGLNAGFSIQLRLPLDERGYKFGSGYGIGPHWVLTAHHVLFGPGVNLAAPIRLSRGDSVEEVSRERILWENEDHDIALIRCDGLVADAPSAGQVLAEKPPAPEEKWSGYGFSGVLLGDVEGRRELSPVGLVGHYQPKAGRATFTSSNVRLKEDDYWAGFSGAPIFVAGRLSAVAIKVNQGEAGAGLQASFISNALDAEGEPDGRRLADLLELGSASARRETERRLEPEIIKRLSGEPVAVERIGRIYRQFIDPTWERNTPGRLFEALRTAPDGIVVSCFIKGVEEFVDEGDRSSVRMMDYLARAWLLFISAERGPFRAISGFKDDPSAKPPAVEVVAPEVVDLEALLAFVEGRQPLLEMRFDRIRAPLNYTPNHPLGLDEEKIQEGGDLHGLLSLHAIPGSGAFFDAAMGRFEFEMTRPESGITRENLDRMSEAQRYAHIDQHLLSTSIRKGGSIYACVSDRNDPQVEKLRGNCPRLLLIEATLDDNAVRGPLISDLNKVMHIAKRFLNMNEEGR